MANDRKRRSDTDSTMDIERLLAEPAASVQAGPTEATSYTPLSGKRNTSGRLSRTQRGKKGLAGQRPDRRESRQRDAFERQKAWIGLTPKQQLQALDSRPGESKKQRAKIEAQRAKEKAPAPSAPVAVMTTPKTDTKPKKGAKGKTATA
jgi:hypothetical protein